MTGPNRSVRAQQLDDHAWLGRLLKCSPAAARLRFRAAVTLPDGRQVFGWLPGGAAVTLHEHELRDELASQLGGIAEVSLSYGRADVITGTAVFEVQTYEKRFDGIRQVLAYSAQCDLPPALALFGNARGSQVLKLYYTLRAGHPPIQMWWHTGERWEHIASEGACRDMRVPAAPWADWPQR
jgi:hypothetical protein